MGAETDDAAGVGPLGRFWRKLEDKALTAAAWGIFSLLAAAAAWTGGAISGEFAASTPGGLVIAAAGGAAAGACLTIAAGWWIRRRVPVADTAPPPPQLHRAFWADGEIRYPIVVSALGQVVVMNPVCTKCGSGVTIKWWRSHRSYFARCVTCNSEHAARDQDVRSVEIRRAVEGLLATGALPDQLQERIDSSRVPSPKGQK